VTRNTSINLDCYVLLFTLCITHVCMHGYVMSLCTSTSQYMYNVYCMYCRTKFDLLFIMQLVNAEKNRSTGNIKVLEKNVYKTWFQRLFQLKYSYLKNMKPWYKIF
jgi:hypothetical protein